MVIDLRRSPSRSLFSVTFSFSRFKLSFYRLCLQLRPPTSMTIPNKGGRNFLPSFRFSSARIALERLPFVTKRTVFSSSSLILNSLLICTYATTYCLFYINLLVLCGSTAAHSTTYCQKMAIDLSFYDCEYLVFFSFLLVKISFFKLFSSIILI